MMNNEVRLLKERIAQLALSEKDKQDLLQCIKPLEKALVIAEFKCKRIDKDKFIATNLLKTSLQELKDKKTVIEESNEKLQKQKLVVEEQSKQLTIQLAELERSYKEMEQFTYIASHDLQSPLRTISSFVTLLSERYQGKLDTQADEFINFINRGTKQMREVINDLLDLSRIGSKNTKYEELDLNKLMESVCFNLNQAIEESSAKIVIDPLPTLFINKSGILQLFQNLIGNSIKFRADRRPLIQVSCKETQNAYEFRVKDNGLGMDEAFQQKAFQPFQRVNNLDRPGTGIGLAICKKVVKLHRGKIYFESVIGEETTFIFTISKNLNNELNQLLKSNEIQLAHKISN